MRHLLICLNSVAISLFKEPIYIARARARIRLQHMEDIERGTVRVRTGIPVGLPVCPFGPLEVTQKALKVKVLTLFILEVSRWLRHTMLRPSPPALSALLARSPLSHTLSVTSAGLFALRIKLTDVKQIMKRQLSNESKFCLLLLLLL